MHNNHLIFCFFLFQSVVSQHYEEDIHKAFVIRGNSAILKCDIPSFVADFVNVISWHTDQEENFYPDTEYGVCNSCVCPFSLSMCVCESPNRKQQHNTHLHTHPEETRV